MISRERHHATAEDLATIRAKDAATKRAYRAKAKARQIKATPATTPWETLLQSISR